MALLGIAALSTITFSLSLTTATNRNVIATVIVITTALWSIPITGSRPGKGFYGWAALLLSSVYLVLAGFSAFDPNVGDLLVILAVTLFGAGNALGQKLIPTFGSEFIINFRLTLGGIILVAIGLIFNGSSSLFVTTVGIIPIVAGLLRYTNILFAFKAMRYLSATKVLTVTTIQVIFTVIGAAIFLSESITASKVIGSFLVVFSVYKIVQTKELSTS